MGVHLSGLVGSIALLPGLAAWFCPLPTPVTVLLAHISGSGLLVAAAATDALAVHTTGLLGKRSDGTIDPVRFALLWPYHFSLRAKLALQRKYSSEPSFNQVTPDYFIGAWPSEQKLVPTVQPAVLDVTCELPLQLVPPAYLNLSVWDTHAPSVPQIEQGVQWALQQRSAGRPVLVHCAHGHGRSATVLGAILVAEGIAKGAADAEAIMKSEAAVSAPHVQAPKALDSTDVVEFVLARLEVKELAAAAQVCRQWRAASLTAMDAWRRAFVAAFGSEDKGADYPQQLSWRDKYIAALLNYAHMRLRSKARFLDEMQDSLQVVQHNYNTLVAAHPEVAAGMPPEACDKREPEAAGPGNNEKQQLLSDMARMEQSLVCLRSCVDKAEADIAELQRRREHLQAATDYRPNVPSS
ncbi:hypothetical protein D9Q98_006191 [Chlorella vulgaris]|uniref:Tyrosine specific protein phosphatases domain-containing protein n=1 Tax=Chlorella vulgaris TaxID=3077 RepID=A0A9D4TX32_CHLVU|nr:hypothetical protein D9Q98_006191 [Chlorella vulgaris]